MSGSSTLSSQATSDAPENEAEEAARRHRRRRRMIMSTSITLAVIALGGLLGWGIYATQKASKYQTPAHASNNADGIVAGGTGKTKVDVYVDYQCTQCKAFDVATGPTLDKLVASNAITLVYHPMAVLDGQSRTQFSMRAAASTGCAADQAGFLAYSHMLFAAQPTPGAAGLTDDQMVQIAGQAGIINPTFARCERSDKYRSWVSHVNAAAAAKHIVITPTVLVNRRSISPAGQAPTLAQLKSALNITG